MNFRLLCMGILLLFASTFAFGQTNGASGRVTGNTTVAGSYTMSTGSLSLSCSDSGCTSATSGTISPTSTAVSGTIFFAASHDASGSIGGSTGGGSGQLQVSCDGGSTWNAVAVGSATLPTTIMSFSYPTPSCTGITNLNTLLFRTLLGGGGATGFNMSITPSSQVIITW